MGSALHVRKNDKVIVLSGDDKDKEGRILKSYPRERRVIVEGVNYIQRHIRRSQQHPKGGIVEKEAPIDVSKLMLVCPHCNKPARTATTRLAGKDRGRVCKRCKQAIGSPDKK
ncbi:MAG: 50S ribosomal protein L24 [Planctomycetes bacterium]|nr:50S ribosomal protein L24 [Planctomycetota bacterium]